MKRTYLSFGLIFFVLLVDQIVKIWVKLNMRLGESFNFFGEGQNWFQIYFTENPGMAFGIELGGDYGKLLLSVFRIIAVGFISYYLYILIKQKKSFGLIASISLIWAGAVGNILDSIFYGLIFTSSVHGVATMTSFGAGYAGFLYGKVVDMLYFPLIEGHYPKWFPFVGGQHFLFFQPIFNIADTSISIGVGMVIVFYKMFFKDVSPDKENEISNNQSTEDKTDVTSEKKDSNDADSSDKNLNNDFPKEGKDIPLDNDKD